MNNNDMPLPAGPAKSFQDIQKEVQAEEEAKRGLDPADQLMEVFGSNDSLREAAVQGLNAISEVTGGILPEAPAILDKPVEESKDLTMGDRAKDIAAQTAQGLVRGGRNVLNLGTELVGYQLPQVDFAGEPETFLGQTAGFIAQYLPGAMGMSLIKGGAKALGLLAESKNFMKLGKIFEKVTGKSTAAKLGQGGVAAGLAFEDEEGVLNLLAEIPGMEGLAIHPSDPTFEKRTKQFADDILAGAAVGALGALGGAAYKNLVHKVVKLKAADAAKRDGLKHVANEGFSSHPDLSLDPEDIHKALNEMDQVKGPGFILDQADQMEEVKSTIKAVAALSDGVGPAPKMSGRLNVDNLDIAKGDAKFIQTLEAGLDQHIADGGGRALDDIKKNPDKYFDTLSQALGIKDPDEMQAFLFHKSGDPEKWSEAVYKSLMSVKILGSKSGDLARKYTALGDKVTNEQLEEWMKTSEMLNNLIPAGLRAARGASDAMSVMKEVKNAKQATANQYAAYRDYLANGGNTEDIKTLMRHVAALEDPAEVTGFVNHMFDKGYGKLTLEAMADGFVAMRLASGKMIVQNTMSGLILAYLKPFEKVIGGAIDSITPWKPLEAVKKGPSFLKTPGDVMKNSFRTMVLNFAYLGQAWEMALKSFRTGATVFDPAGRIGVIDKKATALSAIEDKIIKAYGENHFLGSLARSAIHGLQWAQNIPGAFVRFSDEIIKQMSGNAKVTADLWSVVEERGLVGKESEDFVYYGHKQIIRDGRLTKNPENLIERALQKAKQLGLEGDEKRHYLQVAAEKEKLNAEVLNPIADRGLYHAREVTLQSLEENDGIAGGVLSLTSKMVREFPPTIAALPFRRTPIQLIREATSRIPAIGILADHQYRKLFSKNPEERAAAKGAQATGFMLAAAALTFNQSINGPVTSGNPTNLEPSDLKQSSFNKTALGKEENTINIGGKSYSLRALDPLRTVIMLANNIEELATSGTEQGFEASEYLAHGLGYLLTDSMGNRDLTQNMEAMLEVLTTGDSASLRKLAAVITTGPIPQMVIQATNAWDKYVVNARDYFDKVQKDILGLHGNVNVARDQFGRPVEKGISFGRALIDPFQAKTVPKKDPALEEIVRLNYNPPPYPYLWGGNQSFDLRKFKVPNTTMTYWDWAAREMGRVEIQGRTLHEAVTDLVESKKYNKLDEGDRFTQSPKKVLIMEVFQKYREKVTKNLMDEFPDLKEAKSELKKTQKNAKRGQDTTSNIEALRELRKKLK